MKLAVITLSNQGAFLAGRVAESLPGAEVYAHRSVEAGAEVKRFDRIVELTADIFRRYPGLVYIAPVGVAVRALAPHIRHKLSDPAVVAVDVGGRWAVSLLSGHEGGANDLALAVSNVLSAEPVISTTTEALKRLIVGIGCRRGTDSAAIVHAVRTVLKDADLVIAEVRLLASADIKADEGGLLAASRELGVPIRFISSREIRNSTRCFTHSEFVKDKVNLPAVAEPCALLAGSRTTLLVPKKTYDGVVVAVARERFLWSEYFQAGRKE
ncbi:MAG: cobalamin biosynthesis protein [Pseudomonadota bacterium]